MLNSILSFFTGKKIVLNTKLDRQNITAGETLTGKIIIRNLSLHETLIRNIRITFMAQHQQTSNFRIDKENYFIFKALLREKLIILPQQTTELPFEFTIPLFTPLLPATSLVKTVANLSLLQRYTDSDELIVMPSQPVKTLLDAFWELGFKHTPLSGYIEKHAAQPLQIFMLKPIKEPYLGKFKDIEFFFEQTDQYLEVFMTVNKMTKGLAGMERNEENDKNNKVRFKVMSYETLTVNALSHYLNETLKVLK